MKRVLNENIVKSIVLGHAIGDALGVPVEFESRNNLELTPLIDMIGYGTYNFPEGSWSDDTSMSLCALESISKGKVDSIDIMNNFIKWYYEDEFTPTGEMFDAGFTCSTSIVNYAEIGKSICECAPKDEMSNGNGSLMRIIPFVLYGFVHKNELEKIIKLGSSLTHAHPRSVIACYIYACMLIRLIEEPNKNGILLGLNDAKKIYGNDEEWKYFEPLFDIERRQRKYIKSSGYVVHSLEAAVWSLITTDNYKECVLKAVNLGGDTDSIAAIAGGLAGALYGFDDIPKEWLDKLKKKDYIEKLCTDATRGILE